MVRGELEHQQLNGNVKDTVTSFPAALKSVPLIMAEGEKIFSNKRVGLLHGGVAVSHTERRYLVTIA